MPPRGRCVSVTVTRFGRADDITSPAISAANASANTARSRKPHRYSLRLLLSMHHSPGTYSMTTVLRSGCCVTGHTEATSSLVKVTTVTLAGAGNTSTWSMA